MISPTPQLKMRFALGAVIMTLLGAASAADAQGLVQGVQQGAKEGNKAAGPVGGVLGGAIGGVVGVFTGVLGVGQTGKRRQRTGPSKPVPAKPPGPPKPAREPSRRC